MGKKGRRLAQAAGHHHGHQEKEKKENSVQGFREHKVGPRHVHMGHHGGHWKPQENSCTVQAQARPQRDEEKAEGGDGGQEEVTESLPLREGRRWKEAEVGSGPKIDT